MHLMWCVSRKPIINVGITECKDEREGCESAFNICKQHPQVASKKCRMTCQLCGNQTVAPITPEATTIPAITGEQLTLIGSKSEDFFS